MEKIIFIGRGGQGAKSAAIIVAKAASMQGLFVQAFPEYGPERAGAPVTSYVKLDRQPIRSFSAINEPDFVVLIDETLISLAKKALTKKSILLVNSCKIADYFKKEYNIKNNIITIDANGISLKHLGILKPNVPMIGSLLKLCAGIKIENAAAAIEEYFEKLGKEKINANIRAVKQSYEEVKI